MREIRELLRLKHELGWLEPDWTDVHWELQGHKGMTLWLLRLEHRENSASTAGSASAAGRGGSARRSALLAS